MQFHYPTSLFVAATIDFIVAYILFTNYRNLLKPKTIYFWCIGFLFIAFGNLILNYEKSFSLPTILFMSNILTVSGAILIIGGIHTFLDIKYKSAYLYILPVITVLANLAFDFIWPNANARKISYSLTMMIISIWVVNLSNYGFKTSKQKSWLLFMILFCISILIYIIRTIANIPGIVNNVHQVNLYGIWAFFFNLFIALLLIAIVAQFQLELLKKNIAIRNTMYSIVGHDLKEPLSHIYTLSNIALNPKLANQKRLELLETIRSLSSQSNFLARNLLDWANSNKQTLQLEISEFGAEEILKSEILISEDWAKQNELKLSLNLTNDIVLMIDENMFRLIVRNLVNNAVKHTPVGGTIQINTKLSESHFHITIKNTSNVSNEIVDFVNSTDAINNIKYNGMGLGLVKRYTNLLDIGIKMESSKENETVVNLYIPMRYIRTD